MRVARHLLKDSHQEQFFHVVSRVVDRRLVFGDEEKGSFLRILRQQEDFSGVEILSYCLMGNHFHLLLHIPVRPEGISEEEVKRRMGSIYSKEKMTEYEELLNEWKEMGQTYRIEAFYDGMRQRMYDLSHFVKETKLKFSKWYNARNHRKGTLWEERFRSVIIEGAQQSLKMVSAYIELIVDLLAEVAYAGVVAARNKFRRRHRQNAVLQANGYVARIGHVGAAAHGVRIVVHKVYHHVGVFGVCPNFCHARLGLAQ